MEEWHVLMDRRDFWCLAALAAIPTLFFADVLFAGSNFYHPDLFLYHFPMKHIVREAMLSGEFPFWNRYYSGGQPIAANPAYELFYPLQWLILVGSYRFGFALHIVAHVYVALAGMYLLLREMRLGRPAALFGSLSFGMGGLLIGGLPMLPTFFVWSLAPIVGWGVLRALRKPSAARIAAAALCAGTQLIIGEPIALAQVWLLILAGALIASGFPRTIRILLVIGIAALLVAAVQIAPAVDHVHDSIRSKGIPYVTVAEFAMPPGRPVEILIPHWYGRYSALELTYWGGDAFPRRNPYLPSLYNGIAVAILAIAGFLLRARGSIVVVSLSLLSYVVAIGDRTPLLRALYDAGIARGLRYPEKFAAMGIVALTVFAAAIADRLLSGDDRTRRAAIIASAIVAGACAIPLLWSLMPGFTQSFVAFWHLVPREIPLASLARTNWLVGLAVPVVLLLLIVLLPRLDHRRWMLIAFTVVLFDLAFTLDGLVARMPASYLTPPDVVKLFDRDRDHYNVLHRGEWQASGPQPQMLRRLLGPWVIRNGIAPFSLAGWGVRTILEVDFDETALLPTHDMLSAMKKLGDAGFPYWAESFGAIANVRYIVDYRRALLALQAPDIEHAMAVRLTRIANSGTYYFAQEISTADPGAFMRSPGIRRPIAFVTSPLPLLGPGRVLRVAEHANSAVIDVECASTALLVATVTRQKYWTATIDGQPAPLLPVNLAFQGLIVPAGRHTIEMRYRNPLVLGSMAVSLLAVAVAFALIGAALIRRRRIESA
ncbi:MAG: hypothetical protein QOK37_177 [Thermoanaerobaculia bacterium]|jgi:hypothetical protein|nr:hypothetical protein [Thermoanaerobaculia bacterium]